MGTKVNNSVKHYDFFTSIHCHSSGCYKQEEWGYTEFPSMHYCQFLVIVINETRSCLLDAQDKGFIVWALWSVSIWKGLLINIMSVKIAL